MTTLGNTGILAANLVKDPTLNHTADNIPVANLRVAINHRVQNKDGQWIDGETTFADVSVWRSLGENAAKTLRAGDPIILSGTWKHSTYSTKEGETRNAFTIDADVLAPNLTLATWPTRERQQPGATASTSGPTLSHLTATPPASSGHSPTPAY